MNNIETIRHPAITIPHRAADGVELWAIGDIHGRADLTKAILDAIAATPRAPGCERVLVQTGDVIDRGSGSLRSIDRLIAANVIGLQGNHEQMARLARLNVDHWYAWSGSDGIETLREGLGFSWDHDRRPGRIEHAFGPERWRWLTCLRTSYRSGDVVLVHAGIHPWGNLDAQLAAPWDDVSDDSPFWIRGSFLSRWGDEKRPVFVAHGHTPVDNQFRAGDECRDGRINLDLGSWESGGVRAVRFVGDVVEIVDVWGAGDSVTSREYRRART